MLSKICCFNTQLCKCHCFGLTRNKNIKIGYFLIILTFYLLLLLVNSLTDITSKQTIQSYGCTISKSPSKILPQQQQCILDKNIQVAFVSVGILHLMLFFSMFMKSDKVKIINEGMWIIKVLIGCVVAFVMRLIVSYGFFDLISYASVWIANWVYVFQALVFVDMVFALNISFDQRAKDDRKFYGLKAVLTAIVFLASAILCYYSFKHNLLWISWINVALLVIFLIIAFLRLFSDNSVFVASLISLCMIVISFYIHSSGDQDQPLQSNSLMTIVKAVFLVFMFIGMLFQGSNFIRTRKSSLNQMLSLNTNAADQDNRYVSSSKWNIYHIVMFLICLGIPAVFCWHSDDSYLSVHALLHVNKWVWWGSTLIFYLWSLMGMKLFPSDDFSELQNYFREYELK